MNVITVALADLELSKASLYRVLIIPKGSMLRKTNLTLVWTLYLSLWASYIKQKC